VTAADPFGTADVRRRVLDAWTASPARFREDANAEEDQALGGYRDRLVVELAQNAADAAARSGEPGRLLLALDPAPTAGGAPVLVAANTGAPLDAAGVESLATLRASAKRDDDPATTVGRFGVGFAAVLAVSDEPALRSTTGGVRWSRAETVRTVEALPALAEELARRLGHVPVLRLPWPDPVPPPDGYASAVVLALRDPAAVDLARRQLALVDPALLVMLPALAEVVVRDGDGERVLRAADLDVRRVDASGRLDPALLADRPTEERQATRWWLAWAYPRPEGTPAVLHAPTPTDEPVDLPALLLGSFPLEPSRRHVAPGPLLDSLVDHAARAYADLAGQIAGDGGSADEVLGLVPGPVPAGPLDAVLRAAVVERLAERPLLPGGVVAADALAVDDLPDDARALLVDSVVGLLPGAWARHRALDRLGVRRVRLADLVDDLAALDRPPSWWRSLYDALAGADREALAGLPMPLADGRLVRGPRGAVLPAAGAPAPEALAALGFRVVDPAAVHPLLEALGAVPADPWALLDEPAVQAAVAASSSAEDPRAVADAVLALVAAVRPEPGERPWLARLALPDDEGGWSPAGDLVVPGGRLASLVDADELPSVAPEWLQTWGSQVLAAVGVLDSFGVVRDDDVGLDPDLCDHDLDDEDVWVDVQLDALDRTGPAGPAGPAGPGDDGAVAGPGLPPVARAYTAVRDLDLVRADAWPQALRLLAADPVLRAAVVEPLRAVLADGRSVDLEPYTAWWLRTHPVLDGRRPDELRAARAEDLTGLLPAAADLGLDDAFLSAIGVVTSVADLAQSPMELPLLRAGVRLGRGDPVLDAAAGTVRPVPGSVARVLPDGPRSYVEHDALAVEGVAVDWWVDGDGTVHAATLDGLARGLAWAAGRWSARHVVAEVLADPSRADELAAETAWD
jgi:hypothetical protein